MTETTPETAAEACVVCGVGSPRHGGLCCLHRYAEQPTCENCPAPSASLVAAIAEALASAWERPDVGGLTVAQMAKLAAGVAEPLLREQIAAEIEARGFGAHRPYPPHERDVCQALRCEHHGWPCPTVRSAAAIVRGSAGSAATPETTL